MTPASPRITKTLPAFEEVVIEVKGCSGDLVGCNGTYEYARVHKGKPLYVNTNGKQGVFHWLPSRDGGVWTLNGKNISPDSGYHFSQSPTGTNPSVPPTGQWLLQRFESNCGSAYPEVMVTSKSSLQVPDMKLYTVEVAGCTGDMAECNGTYNFDRMHMGKPLFVHSQRFRGVLYWLPGRDGGVWALNGRDILPESGYNFSQSPDALPRLPPSGRWEHERFESSGGSAYPRITVAKKSEQESHKMDDVGIEVSGCTGELSACNGLYIFNRIHKEKPLFLNSTGGKGVLFWNPYRDGGIWSLNAKSNKAECGYNFSQSPEADSNLPPAGQWRGQRIETTLGSPYPLLTVVSRIKRSMTENGGIALEVTGCTADLAPCNGYYEYDRLYRGRPLFSNCSGGRGVVFWNPDKDGGVWALNGRSSKPEAGYNFSQRPTTENPSFPPAGQWRCERWETNNGMYPIVNVISKAGAPMSPNQPSVRARPLQSPRVTMSRSSKSYDCKHSQWELVSPKSRNARSEWELVSPRSRGSRAEWEPLSPRSRASRLESEVPSPRSRGSRAEWDVPSPRSRGSRAEWEVPSPRSRGCRSECENLASPTSSRKPRFLEWTN